MMCLHIESSSNYKHQSVVLQFIPTIWMKKLLCMFLIKWDYLAKETNLNGTNNNDVLYCTKFLHDFVRSGGKSILSLIK